MEEGDWHWGISNPGPAEVMIWLEPWAEEFHIPARSTLVIGYLNPRLEDRMIEAENDVECIVIWAGSGDRLEISIDGKVQESSSAITEVPEAFGMSTKHFLGIVFGNQPQARLGGRPSNVNAPISFWVWLKSKLGAPLRGR